MGAISKPRTAYGELVASFDHEKLAGFPAYQALRQALSDLSNQIGESDQLVSVVDLLADVRDMTLTAPFGDCCARCHDLVIHWPHAAVRDGDRIHGHYRCGSGHRWTCNYAVDLPAFL